MLLDVGGGKRGVSVKSAPEQKPPFEDPNPNFPVSGLRIIEPQASLRLLNPMRHFFAFAKLIPAKEAYEG